VSFVGGGLGYRHAHREALLNGDDGPDLLEVIPEQFFANPGELDVLAERYPLAFHCVGLSVGTAVADTVGDDVTRTYLRRLRELVRRVEPLYLGEHLAFTRAPNGADLGHVCPLPYTDETYGLVSTRVSAWQDRLEIPLVLKNIAHPFLWPCDTMTAGAFFERLVRETDCGLLLDVSNVLYDARNFGWSPATLLGQYPLEEVRAVHLAGGTHSSRDRFWTDSHDQPVEEECFALLARLRGRSRLQAAVVTRDRRLPPLSELLAESRRAAGILRG
jgi:hypothetical protein